MENIDQLKNSVAGSPTYRLSNANVFVSPRGFHFIDYLDPIEEVSPEISDTELSQEEIQYIEKYFQSNPDRFSSQLKNVSKWVSLQGKSVLDIGCGSGVFLTMVKEQGAKVLGIELNNERAYYAKCKNGIEVLKRPIEDAYCQKHYANAFDVVCLWDVIEHVNYPMQTLASASRVMKKGGYLFIDTPVKDGFYHRVGSFTYKVSNGKFPTFLDLMYSSHRFGHKQIFSTREMRDVLENVGFEVLEIRKFHELTFPYSFYLHNAFKSDYMVKLTLPLVQLAFPMLRVHNKMMVTARKK